MVRTSLLDSLRLAHTALAAHQTTLDTIGHNLANVATPGYTRQRAALTALPIRQGVTVAEIERIRDGVLTSSLLAEQQALGRSRAERAMLERLQAVFADPPDGGLAAQLDALFGAFHDLSIHPTDATARLTVRDRAAAVVTTIRDLRARLRQLGDDLTAEIQAHVTTANRLLSDVAELNRRIAAAGGGTAPNDLLDRRDSLVTQLADTLGVTATERTDGTVQLVLSGTGVVVVDGVTATLLAASVDRATDTVNVATMSGIAVTPRSGALGAVLEARNAESGPLRQAVRDLDTLAAALVREVNALHTSGAGLHGYADLTAARLLAPAAAPLAEAGLPIVDGTVRIVVWDASGTPTASAVLAVAPAADSLEDLRAAIDALPDVTATIVAGALRITAAPGHTFGFADDTSGVLSALGLNAFFTGADAATIALAVPVAADPGLIAAGTIDAAGRARPGDGGRALELARLRSALVMDAGTSTFIDGYAKTVGRVASRARQASDGVERQEAVVQFIERLHQQRSGVSVDEELIALTQSQTAYAAAARYATVVRDALDALFRMVG